MYGLVVLTRLALTALQSTLRLQAPGSGLARNLGLWAHFALSHCEDRLTFWGCELNVILLAEGGWEDGVGGGMITEPV